MLSGRWSPSFTQVSAVLYCYLFFPAVVSPDSCPAGLLWLYRIKACEGRSNLPRQAIQAILLQTVRGTDFGSVSPNTSQHFAWAWIFCPADSAGTREGEWDVQIGKVYPASKTKAFLDLCWLTEVCVNIFISGWASVSQCPHESPMYLSGTTITMPECCATDGI